MWNDVLRSIDVLRSGVIDVVGFGVLQAWGVLLVFGNFDLVGVQSPILFILECCSMVEVGCV